MSACVACGTGVPAHALLCAGCLDRELARRDSERVYTSPTVPRAGVTFLVHS